MKHPGLVLLALALGAFAFGTTEFAAMSLLPFLARGLHVSEPTASHIISAYALGVVVGAPLITVLATRFSRRGLLLSLMGLFTLANGLSTLALGYGWMLLFRFISGLPHGAYLGVAALVAAAQVPQNRKAWAVSRVFLGLRASPPRATSIRATVRCLRTRGLASRRGANGCRPRPSRLIARR